MGAIDRHGAQGRNGEFLRRLRQRNQGDAGYQPLALFGDHPEGDFPSHARDGAAGVCTHRGKESALNRLHYRRSAIVAAATSAAAHAEPERGYQDGDYSRTLELRTIESL